MYNKIILIGHLGTDPELRYTPQGTAVCNFRIATNERRLNASGEPEEITTWFRITIWGTQAENIAKMVRKGKQIFVEGRLRVNEWTDRDGKLRYTLEVVANDVRLLGTREGDSKQEETSYAEEPEFSQEFNNEGKDDDEEIPF